jgi:uncharacterized repeat protein (TIGR02543 family)
MAFPGELNINYYKGDTHKFKVYPQRPDGSGFGLSSYGNSTFTIATERGANPTQRIFGSARIYSDYVECVITPENGAEMDPAITYVYDVQIYSPGPDTYDDVFTLLTGSISVTDDVTQDIGNPNRAIPTYRVIYHNTDATGGVVPVDTNEYLPNKHMVVANNGTLVREGYTFGGWTKFADNSGTVYSAGDFIPISADIKLYPKWLPPTVTWNNQDATTSQVGGSTYYIPQSAIISIPTTPPSDPNYTFGGWWTGPAGTGTQVTNNSYTPTPPYGPITLYAKWTAL